MLRDDNFIGLPVAPATPVSSRKRKFLNRLSASVFEPASVTKTKRARLAVELPSRPVPMGIA